VNTTLEPRDWTIVWELVAARLVENRRAGLSDLFHETLDEYARLKAQFEQSDPYLFAVGGTRWTVTPTGEGTFTLRADAHPLARR